jgi:hypothetical protein
VAANHARKGDLESVKSALLPSQFTEIAEQFKKILRPEQKGPVLLNLKNVSQSLTEFYSMAISFKTGEPEGSGIEST